MPEFDESPFDEEAAMEAAREKSAGSLRDALRREYDEALRRGPRDERVERRMLEIDEMIVRDLQRLRKRR